MVPIATEASTLNESSSPNWFPLFLQFFKSIVEKEHTFLLLYN